MGERFLLLEETADALDVIDPELAVQFRMVNGLPKLPAEEVAAIAPAAGSDAPGADLRRHEIRMDVGDRQIRSDCTCGEWHSAVDWDEIDTMVVQILEHLGPVYATSGDGITAPTAPSAAGEQRVG